MTLFDWITRVVFTRTDSRLYCPTCFDALPPPLTYFLSVVGLLSFFFPSLELSFPLHLLRILTSQYPPPPGLAESTTLPQALAFPHPTHPNRRYRVLSAANTNNRPFVVSIAPLLTFICGSSNLTPNISISRCCRKSLDFPHLCHLSCERALLHFDVKHTGKYWVLARSRGLMTINERVKVSASKTWESFVNALTEH